MYSTVHDFPKISAEHIYLWLRDLADDWHLNNLNFFFVIVYYRVSTYSINPQARSLRSKGVCFPATRTGDNDTKYFIPDDSDGYTAWFVLEARQRSVQNFPLSHPRKRH